MKCQVPQISWHGRDPVLSIDFQPIKNDVFRLASGGTDSHVLIWYITYQENKSIKVECASDLYRHNKSVNVVRFSPNGEFLASGDDEGAVFIWELKERELTIDSPTDDENINKEEWYPVKLLRGHLDDIYDICWSKDGNYLVSSSMDNTAIIWDMQKYNKVHIFSDFKGYVQGVSWDPLNQFIASVGSDRALRIHNISSKKIVYKVSKAPWTNSTEKGTFKARLFYDDTLQSYFRRLTFTPDGEFLIVPSGISEKGEKINNTCYIFSRHALNKPVISLFTGDKYTVAVRCNPFLYKLRSPSSLSDKENKENEPAKPMISLPYRIIFAVAASDSVLLYDTEQLLPFAYVSNIHYTHLTDLSWSSDGLTLVVSSTDGYCSFILFSGEELGEVYVPEKPKEVPQNSDEAMKTDKNEKAVVAEPINVSTKTDEALKKVSTPVTPKNNTPIRTTPLAAKSPGLLTEVKEDGVTSSKVAKNSSESKKTGKKSPKMCSIKKFFISPKTVGANSAVGNKKPVSPMKKEAKIGKVLDIIDLSDSPVNDKKSTNVSKPSEGKNLEKEEPMDVDKSPAKKSSSDDVQKSPSSSGHPAKCKVRLDFTDKDELVANIDDNASDSNPLSGELTMDDEPKCVEGSENDWKLELSQDDEIVPMEATPAETASKAMSAGPSYSSKVEPSVSPAAVGPKPSDNKSTPKRRVAFVTLSSKSSIKK